MLAAVLFFLGSAAALGVLYFVAAPLDEAARVEAEVEAIFGRFD